MNVSHPDSSELATLEEILRGTATEDLSQAVKTTIAKLSQLDYNRDIRNIETGCTHIATAARGVPAAAYQLAANRDWATPQDRAFAAVVAGIGYRRAGQASESRQALELLKSLEAPWPHQEALRLHLQSLTYSNGPSSGLSVGLCLSKRASELAPDNPGILHALAEFELENAIWVASDDALRNDLLSSSYKHIERAIVLQEAHGHERWAKFHFNRARIRLRLARSDEEFLKAMSELDQAIDQEAEKSIDFTERRARYHYEKLLSETRWAMVKMTDEMAERQRESTEEARRFISDRLGEQSRRNQVQTVAAVGFLTSLIALLQFAAALFVTADRAAESDAVSFWYLLVAIIVVAALLLGSVLLATRLLARETSPLREASSEKSS